MTDKEIMNRVQEHYSTAESLGYEVVGVFLHGSQNYELEYKGSDIDCKAVVLPKFNDFVLNNKMISTTHVLENNEHIDLKDIRLMFDCFKKQNINFVEILFTKYKIINPKYESFWKRLVDSNELIARYNNYSSVTCMSGMTLEKYKALEHPYPATMDKIEQYGYDGKQLHHLLRLKEFIQRFANGEKYADCLISKSRDYLINVKCNKEYNLDEARKVATETKDFIINYKKEYMDTHQLEVNKDVDNMLNGILFEILKENFKTELGV